MKQQPTTTRYYIIMVNKYGTLVRECYCTHFPTVAEAREIAVEQDWIQPDDSIEVQRAHNDPVTYTE